MTKRRLLTLMVSGLLVAVAPLVGCGETDDPSVNANNQNNTNQNNTNQNNQNNTNQNNTNQNNTNQNNQTPECTIQADCEDWEFCNDDGVCEEEAFEPVVCDDADWFYGQITDADSVNYGGGIPTTDPLTEGFGLQEVWDAVDAAWDPSAEGSIQVVFEEPIQVEATIIATAYGERRLFLQDADRAMYLVTLSGENPVPVEQHVGQRVRFDAVRADIFFGNPQIREFANWEVIETPEDEQFVPYVQIEDQQITNEDHFYQNVRVVGWLSTDENDQWACGGDTCYRMYYGTEAQHTITFKSGSDFISPGDCVTFVGPVLTFPGLYQDGAEAQLDQLNWDWAYYSSDGGLD